MSNQTANQIDVQYGQLTENAWPYLVQLFESRGIPPALIPHPDMTVAAGALDASGTLLGALFFQMCWHLEPLVIGPGQSGRVSASELKAVIEAAVGPTLVDSGPVRYYVQLEDSPAVRAVAEREGLRPVVGKVLYEGVIEPRA